ncbi:MAG: hypothetical protein ABIK09_08415 [Pseudomonadota bacterium]
MAAMAICGMARAGYDPLPGLRISALDNGSDRGRLLLPLEDLEAGTHHTRHAEIFGRYAPAHNRDVLRGIDAVQETAMDGGGFFIGIRAKPTESPIGYRLKLFGHDLLDPPRKTSYCSGATFAALIEGLNKKFGDADLSADRVEALRMQEPGGGRREDGVKFWGHWNADGYGNHFALVQYSGMGEVVSPEEARPGDFMNISWVKGGGHSVIFLGWHRSEKHGRSVLYWSSQRGSNGLGDQLVPISRIDKVMIVRLTDPTRLFTFDTATPVRTRIPGARPW